MKTVKLVILLTALGFITSCDKTCTEPSGACNDTPAPVEGMICQAYFESWFYNAQTNTCEFAGYSGCEPKGFPTEAECQSCLQHKNR